MPFYIISATLLEIFHWEQFFYFVCKRKQWTRFLLKLKLPFIFWVSINQKFIEILVLWPLMGQTRSNEPDRLTMSVELLIKFWLGQVVESDTRWSAKLTTGITLHENGIRGYVTQCVVSHEDHRSVRWKQSKLLLAGRWKSCHENVGRWPFFARILCSSSLSPLFHWLWPQLGSGPKSGGFFLLRNISSLYLEVALNHFSFFFP